MIKNNPYKLLNKSGIDKLQLSAKAQEALKLFDDTEKDLEKFPNDELLKGVAEQVGQEVCELIQEEIKRFQVQAVTEHQANEQKLVKKHQSAQVMKQAHQTIDELEECRQALREDRRRKVLSGEIHAPKRKPLTVRLRGELLKTAHLIPKALKDDPNVISATKKLILKFLHDLKSIWGLDRIKGIEDDLKKQFDKLEEHAHRAAKEN